MEQSTLSDYFDPLQSAAMAESIIGSRINNRINSLALQEQTDKLQKDQALQNVLRSYYGGGAPSPNGGGTLALNPMISGTPPVSSDTGGNPAGGGGGMNYTGTRPPAPGGRISGNLMSDLGRIDPNIPYTADQARIKLEQDQKKQLVTGLLNQAKVAAEKGNNTEYHQSWNAIRSIIPDAPDMSKMVIGPKPGTMSSVVEVKNGVMPGGKPLIDPLTQKPVKDGTYSVKGEKTDQDVKFTSVIPYKKPETPEERSAIKRKDMVFGSNLSLNREKQIANYKKAIGSADMSQPLSKGDEAMARKIANGKMAPAQAPKRSKTYGNMLARAIELNPDLDIEEADAQYKMRTSTKIAEKQIGIESMPEILGKIKDLGTKLKFSNYSPIGKAQAGYKAMTNDPEYQKFIALRNDAVQSIASVMRNNGATDKSIELEVEAGSKHMSPRALQGWYEAQMESLAPRRAGYDRITGKTGATKTRPAIGTKFETLPDPASMSGVTLNDGKGGHIRSDGTKWNKVN